MHKYRVINRHADESRVLLEGGAGRYHWARVLNALPEVGAMLVGSRPHLGFGLLLCAGSTRPFRIIFEAINCSDPSDIPHWAFKAMSTHPGSAPADR